MENDDLFYDDREWNNIKSWEEDGWKCTLIQALSAWSPGDVIENTNTTVNLIKHARAEIINLRADNEWLIHTANRLVEALRPFMSGLKGQYPSFTDELPIFAGASADDLQFILKIGNFRLAHYLVEEFDKKNYSKELPILMEYEEKLSRLRAENETLRRDVKTAIMGDSAELQDVKRENEKLREALAAERERCTKIAEQARDDTCDGPVAWSMADGIAAAIRESGK